MITDSRDLERAAETLAGGHGPAGVDAERASGFRYGSEAYLVQVHRRGAGTFLFDPTEIDDFSALDEAIRGEEWILHAASQDLPCLDAIGLRPQRLFDTELASRLLGFERVGLGSIVEQLLGIRLSKAHSAADWSTRPLPGPWLEYAALDVALLPDLRDAVEAELEAQGKTGIAEQEFEA
ncbi:MAG: ribonuclease D, partial [Actinobacteria bacterium]|nr:ribonuclease D [Actinomycetota bacterium]